MCTAIHYNVVSQLQEGKKNRHEKDIEEVNLYRTSYLKQDYVVVLNCLNILYTCSWIF